MLERRFKRKRVSRRVRSRSLLGLLTGAASLVVLPVAIAWACAPSTGQIAFERPSYSAGQTVVVFGTGFAANNPVQLTLQPPSGAPSAVAPEAATNASGYFEVSFSLPAGAAPGTYAVQARTDPSGAGHGGQVQPTTATKTFTVIAPAAPAAPVVPAPALAVPLSTGPAQVVDNRAKRARAVRRCKRKYKAKRSASTSRKRTMRKKRATCIRRAKKRYPLAPSQ